MEPDGFMAVCTGGSLPLASLRLLVPPVHLVTAWMWRVLKTRDVRNYWNVAEFVSLVVQMVPELLRKEHRSQLDLGLRARFILELCRSEQLVKAESIVSYLNKMESTNATLMDLSESEEDVTVNFLNLTRTLLRDPEERRGFFMDVFPAEFGAQYDSDLLTLFSEFLYRLAQLLPVPDLRQTVSWLGTEPSLLEDCSQVLCESTDLENLLLHHKNLLHLEEHVPPHAMGGDVLSSISAATPRRATEPTEQSDRSSPQRDPTDDEGPSASADHVITVSHYSEVELSSGTHVEVVMGENQFAGDPQVEFLKENVTEEEEAKPTVAWSRRGAASGPHDCPHCKKKFKFASSLLAHGVIHSGERPHRCSDCGRSFSFRQSLDRHRQTHRSARTYECIVCKASFRSLAARTEHKRTHMRDGAYACRRCNKTFSWEPSLARHLKAHAGDHDARQPAGSPGGRPEGVADGDAAQPGGGRFSENAAGRSGEPPSSGPGLDPVKVRTSGRKRVPTMKIQVTTLQKHETSKRRREMTGNPPATKTSPLVCSDHSYGSSVVSKDADESSWPDVSAAALSCSRRSFQHAEEAEVQQHMDERHAARIRRGADGPFSCADCGKIFEFQSLLRSHGRVHSGEQPFSCSHCGQRFSFKQSLQRHQETHRSGRQFRCLICGQLFGSAAEQRHHRSSHMENGDFLCSECGQTFTWRSALVRHLKRHDAQPDKVDDSYTCPHCGQRFSRASHLHRHVQTHRERAHACSCGKSFACRAALTAHQRVHQKERPHACSQCGKGFLYRGGLLSHMKVHSEEMPFMCSFCGKGFKRERSMKKHERCHTREDVFSCSQCDKSFVYKATLVRHELTHSGERPYLCSHCGKGFFSHAELLKHERFHTGHRPFQCQFCSKAFTQSCYLTTHLRYHTGVRPYSCSDCDKSFLSANRLKRHQRTHSGEKPYLCGECGKGFRQSYHLKMHQRTHAS